MVRKYAFLLSRPPSTPLGPELGYVLRRADMNRIYNKALPEAGENEKELKKLLNQENDLARQNISLNVQ